MIIKTVASAILLIFLIGTVGYAEPIQLAQKGGAGIYAYFYYVNNVKKIDSSTYIQCNTAGIEKHFKTNIESYKSFQLFHTLYLPNKPGFYSCGIIYKNNLISSCSVRLGKDFPYKVILQIDDVGKFKSTPYTITCPNIE